MKTLLNEVVNILNENPKPASTPAVVVAITPQVVREIAADLDIQLTEPQITSILLITSDLFPATSLEEIIRMVVV